MRALFVSELGAGYGNVGPLAVLAEQLEAEGVRPFFALADGVTPTPIFIGKGWPVLAAPALREPLKPKPGPATYGDILAACGFADAETLHALVAQWDALFELVRPDFIVASHAPSAILAARGRIPVCAIGTGFTLPPSHLATFPALRPDTMSFRPEFVALDAANIVLKRRNAPQLATLPALLAVQARLVCSIAALDPYAPVRRDPYVRLSDPIAASPAPQTNSIFAFLDVRGPESLNAIECLAAFSQHGPVEAYLRGPGAAGALGFLNRCGVRTHDRPANMADILKRSRVVLRQGGHGSCAAALTAGRASVVLPAHFESMLNGLALERRNVAKVAWGGAVDTIAQELQWALNVSDETLQAASAEIADPYALDATLLVTHLTQARLAA